eukprot:6074124-Amphidinium_carterae.1
MEDVDHLSPPAQAARRGQNKEKIQVKWQQSVYNFNVLLYLASSITDLKQEESVVQTINKTTAR